jgi:NAD-dependent DNA ligase
VLKRVSIAILLTLVATGTVFALRPVERRDLGAGNGQRRVAIVSEWSRYKERLIDALVEELDDGNTALYVRNFDDFSSIESSAYDAVVVINAGVGSEVRKPVVDWLDRQRTDENIVVLTTQISDWTPQITVDSVTSASRNQNIPDVSGELARQVRSYFR